MLKKRLIFTLLYDSGNYMLSRNFRLQEAGNLEWLRENYSFDAIAFSIDELVVLNVSRKNADMDEFCAHLIELSKKYFLPVSAGGWIRSVEDGYKILNANADKLVLNTAIIENPNLVSSLSKIFGRQCVVISIDAKKIENDYYIFIKQGSYNTGLKVQEIIRRAEDLGSGEIYLTSIEKDGTGFGYDLNLLELAGNQTKLPIIASGGVGKYSHFIEGLKYNHIQAVSTANIYNFVVDGLINARRTIEKNGINLASWEYSVDKFYHSCKEMP
ncbi:imidazole glycerol phosphate synthase subunit hisF [Candidatus Omnitrophus magneticus]|uniref:Imidazole glycerol phosphate synthase subunit hisF n=1 Tax=Candidatus Omnitrophus magneticus TaxID=1609969 RepID=A0A0F0CPP7_9BACT|nr:imidazole glycerol phosphate synthase subunit hisF [Candidatus Omnitrophus magneticus]